jgi:anti-sigma B factor antagonist
MSLTIEQRTIEGITILDLKGRLIVGEGVSALREAVRGLAQAGHVNIVLNLHGVDYIDSTGLGSLVVCFTSLQKAGGALKILNLSKRNIELLVLTKLSTVFEIFNDEQDAINSFFPNREIKRFDILDFVQTNRQAE